MASAIVDNAPGATLTLSGPGITTLSGTNTYSGTTYINNGSTLQVGSGGNSGTLGSGNVTDNGALIFSRSDAGLIVAAAISGSGGLLQNGSGMVTLAGSNSYGGGTTVSSGTLQIGNGGGSGSLAGNITDNGVVLFSRSDSVTFSNVISGTGSVVQAGPGRLLLSGSYAYTGSTTVSGGTLSLGGPLALQQSTLDTSGTGTLSFGSLTAATLGGLTGPGTLRLANSASVPVAVQVGNNGASTIFSGALNGAGSLTKVGGAQLTLCGSNTYTGATAINGGTLQIGNGTTDGTIASSSGINDNATLVYNVAGSQGYGKVISGSGGLYKTGGGTLTLTGNNTFSGPTIVNGGSLVGNTASLPSAISLANNANLIFSQATGGASAMQSAAAAV